MRACVDLVKRVEIKQGVVSLLMLDNFGRNSCACGQCRDGRKVEHQAKLARVDALHASVGLVKHFKNEPKCCSAMFFKNICRDRRACGQCRLGKTVQKSNKMLLGMF